MSFLEYIWIKDDHKRVVILTAEQDNKKILDSNYSSVVSQNTPINSLVHECSRPA